VGAIKRVLLWSAIAVLGGRLVILYLIPAWNSIVTDFPNYYTAAWAVRHGDPLSDLYDPVWFEREKHHAGIERPAALFNYFPPINALVLWPLANLSPIGAKRAWTVLNMVALGAVILLTVKATGIGFLPAMAIALLGGDALGNNLAYGQFYIVLTLLLLAGVLAAERFPAIAGAAVATGTVAKLFPMALLVYLAIRRKYRVLIWAATAMIALTLVGVVVLGWAPHRVYLQEVLRPTLRGEIQDPYNVHWNTLQALLRRAFVREEILNPAPILDAPWLFFFLRPLVSIAIVAVTLFAISRARRHDLLVEYGAIIAMVSLITPSQASYHQVLFYPAVAGGIASARRLTAAFVFAGIFALICSNVMGATAAFDRGLAMVLAFPRVYLALALWVIFLVALNPSKPAFGPRFAVVGAGALLAILTIAFLENNRWAADIADGATLVPLAHESMLDVQPRFVNDHLVTSSLGADGFSTLPPETEPPAQSPDGRWTVFATNARGNWDIALRSNRTGEIRFLTTSSANDVTPCFSPDGRSVYFASDRHRGYRFTTIYRVDVDVR